MSASDAARRIVSRDNSLYRELKRLAEDKRSRRALGQTLLDGEHLVEAAHAAGIPVRILIVAASQETERLARWQHILPGAELVVLDDALFKPLSPVQTPTGLLAQIAIPMPGGGRTESAILLEDIQDPANLGAVLRCAAASGIDAAYLSAGCAEAWSPKALRGGQGAQFVLDIYEAADLPAVARGYAGCCHAAVLGAGQSLYGLDLTGRCAFALGNEGAGLSDALRAHCRPFTIPMPGRVESLNVAAAAAVCLFERVRQKQRAA